MELYSRPNPDLPLSVFATQYDGSNANKIVANYPGMSYFGGVLRAPDSTQVVIGDYIYRTSTGSPTKKCSKLLFEETYN